MTGRTCILEIAVHNGWKSHLDFLGMVMVGSHLIEHLLQPFHLSNEREEMEMGRESNMCELPLLSAVAFNS